MRSSLTSVPAALVPAEGTWEYLVAKYYTAGYRTYACEPKRDNVSTFNLFEYVVHLKVCRVIVLICP